MGPGSSLFDVEASLVPAWPLRFAERSDGAIALGRGVIRCVFASGGCASSFSWQRMSTARRAAETQDAMHEIEVVDGDQVIKIWLWELELAEAIDDRDVHRPADAGWLAQKRD